MPGSAVELPRRYGPSLRRDGEELAFRSGADVVVVQVSGCSGWNRSVLRVRRWPCQQGFQAMLSLCSFVWVPVRLADQGLQLRVMSLNLASRWIDRWRWRWLGWLGCREFGIEMLGQPRGVG